MSSPTVEVVEVVIRGVRIRNLITQTNKSLTVENVKKENNIILSKVMYIENLNFRPYRYTLRRVCVLNL